MLAGDPGLKTTFSRARESLLGKARGQTRFPAAVWLCSPAAGALPCRALPLSHRHSSSTPCRSGLLPPQLSRAVPRRAGPQAPPWPSHRDMPRCPPASCCPEPEQVDTCGGALQCRAVPAEEKVELVLLLGRHRGGGFRGRPFQ